MSEPAPRRLLVVWTAQEPKVAIHDIGCLSVTSRGYAFAYLSTASELTNFAPFSSFPDFGRQYESTRLFPFFSSRIIAPERADYAATCTALGLDASSADPLQLLDRTGGTRKGDRVAVIGEPVVAADGTTSHAFLVKGLRFALPEPQEREAVLARFADGDELSIRCDQGNAVNPHARFIVTSDGTALGWVPDGLIPYVARVLESPGSSLCVARLNGPEQPAHLRVLVRVTGIHAVDVPPLPQLPCQRAELVGNSL